jgi:hypothetical protein
MQQSCIRKRVEVILGIPGLFNCPVDRGDEQPVLGKEEVDSTVCLDFTEVLPYELKEVNASHVRNL